MEIPGVHTQDAVFFAWITQVLIDYIERRTNPLRVVV